MADYDYLDLLEGLNAKSAKQTAKDSRKLQSQTDAAAMDRLSKQLEADAQTARDKIASSEKISQAELTGFWQGIETLPSKQFQLDNEIKRGTLALQQQQAQFENAMAEKNYELANRIQTEQVRLQGVQVELERQKNAVDAEVKRAEQSGYLENGQLTENARAARAKEALEKGNSLGYYTDPVTGQQIATDASQQWRAGAALDYAKTAANLKANPRNYFESDAYITGANATGVPNSLGMFNPATGVFRSAQTGLPATGAMTDLYQTPNMVTTGQAAGPSPSVAANMAATNGLPAAFDTSMHQTPQPATMATPDMLGVDLNQRPMDINTSQNPVDYSQAGTYALPSGYSLPVQRQLQAFAPTFQAGAHKLAPGTMESLNPTQLGLFQSAAAASGVDPEAFTYQYKRSRIHNEMSPLRA